MADFRTRFTFTEITYGRLTLVLNNPKGSIPGNSQEIVRLARKALTLAETQEQKASLGSLVGKISGLIQEKQGKIFSVFSKSLLGLKQIEQSILQQQDFSTINPMHLKQDKK